MGLKEIVDDFETTTALKVVQAVGKYLNARDKVKPRVLGLITAEELREELGIGHKTLERWETSGLKRYQPPLESTRKIFYKVSDVLVFLGVDNGKD